MKRAARIDPDAFKASEILDIETPGWEYAKPELGKKLKDAPNYRYIHDLDSWAYASKHNCAIMPLESILKSKEAEGLIKPPKSFNEVFWMWNLAMMRYCIEENGKVDWNEWNW